MRNIRHRLNVTQYLFRSRGGDNFAHDDVVDGEAIGDAVAFAVSEEPGIASRHIITVNGGIFVWEGGEDFAGGVGVEFDVGFDDEVGAGGEEIPEHGDEVFVEEAAGGVALFPPGVGEEDVDSG